MDFDKLILDTELGEQLLQLAIREGIISADEYGVINDDEIELMKKRVSQKSRILSYLTLFNSFDFGPNAAINYKFDAFIQEGMLSQKSSLLNYKRQPSIWEWKNSEQYYYELALSLINSNKELIIKQLQKSIYFTLPLLKKERYTFYLDNYIRVLNENKKTEIDNLRSSITKTEWIESAASIDNPRTDFLDFYECMNDILEDIVDSLKKSHESQSQYMSSFKFKSNNINNHKIEEDFFYTVKAELKKEMLIIPKPNSISELFKIRKKKEIQDFRETLTEWIKIINEGNPSLEKKIRTDIYKANKELKRIGSYMEFKESPFCFWLNSIGGHIPILSNILTVINMSGGFYEKWAKKQSNWILFLDEV